MSLFNRIFLFAAALVAPVESADVGKCKAPWDAVSLIQNKPYLHGAAAAPRARGPGHLEWHVGKEAYVAANNLGGLGPETTDDPEIRFHNVSYLTTGEEVLSLDLVITVDLVYYNNAKIEKNGARGEFGYIFVKKGKSNTFRFTFVKTGTYETVVVPEFDFTIFDLDQAGPERFCDEMITAWQVKKFAMLPDAYGVVVNDMANRVSVCSNSTINNGYVTNPKTINQLSHAQARASIMFSYENTSTFEITFTNNAPGPRAMIFAGTSLALEPPSGQWHEHFDPINYAQLPDGYSQEYIWNVGMPARVTANNLGGRGPNFDDPPEIRYKNVGLLHTYDEENNTAHTLMLDLVAFIEGAYWGSAFVNKHWNGANGEYGEIGISRRSEATIIFTFVETDTHTPWSVPIFNFTLYDIDNQQDTSKGEVYTVHGAHAYTMREDGFTTVELKPDRTILTSNVTILNGAIPNPVSREALTDDQERAAVTFQFRETAVWSVHFKVTADLERAVVFGGVNPVKKGVETLCMRSPTPSPTANPVAAPTPSPTFPVRGAPQIGHMEVPAPAPAISESQAFGDPHVMNIGGEKFDIQRTGHLKFLAIPRGAVSINATLVVYGQVDARGDQCTGQLYITRIFLIGSWLGNLQSITMYTETELFNSPETIGLKVGTSGNLSVSDFVSRLDPAMAEVDRFLPMRPIAFNQHATTLLVKLHLGPTTMKVTWEHTREKAGYSNSLMLLVSGLRKVNGTVGGILGSDNHTLESSHPAECLNDNNLRVQENALQLENPRGVRAYALLADPED